MPENNGSPDQEATNTVVQDGGEISEYSSSNQNEDDGAATLGDSVSDSGLAKVATTESSPDSDDTMQTDDDSSEAAKQETTSSDAIVEATSDSDTQEASESTDPSGSAVEPAEDSQVSALTEKATGSETAVPESEPTAKKRKRRKKRKQAAEAGATEDSSAEEGSKKAKRKDSSMVPFARFLPGPVSGKKHVFAVNEVVAGRVVRCEHGAVIIDLFGKAIAIADELEPREIPSQSQVTPPATGDEETNGETDEAEASEPMAGDAVQSTIEESDAQIQMAEPLLPPDGSTDEAEIVAAESSDDALAASIGDETESIKREVAVEEGEETSTEDGTEYEKEVEPEVSETRDASDDTEGESIVENDDSPAEESVTDVPPDPPKIGQIFKGRIGAVAESGHVALINRIIDIDATRKKIEEFREQHKRVMGLVFGFNRGGFDVMVEGIRAFCPASGMSLDAIDNPKDHIGKKIEFTIPASKGSSKDLIISRRSILEKEHRKRVKEFLRSLKPGQKCNGKVTQVREYGLFVDIGGVEGLVHQSELSFAFGAKPQEVAQIGDEIEVQVIKISTPGDAKKETKRDRTTRVDLSIKALLPDPWETHTDAVSEGSVQQGKVIRTTDFGAFLELAPSIEGLLHISELGRDLKHANQVLKEGEEVYVVVERADKRTRRISLSKLSDSAIEDYKKGRLVEPGERPQSLQPGARVKVKVDAYESRGLIVRVIGAAGKRGRGYIPNNETGTERGTDLRKKFPSATELEVKIIGIERDGSLKCSIKAVAIDDERRAIKEYRREASKQGFGTFGDLLKAKLSEVSRE